MVVGQGRLELSPANVETIVVCATLCLGVSGLPVLTVIRDTYGRRTDVIRVYVVAEVFNIVEKWKSLMVRTVQLRARGLSTTTSHDPVIGYPGEKEGSQLTELAPHDKDETSRQLAKEWELWTLNACIYGYVLPNPRFVRMPE